jgi:hypothetical protein
VAFLCSTRYQIMNQRTVPGFEPSAESYATGLARLGPAAGTNGRAGFDAQEHVDLYVAMLAGLAEARLANQPDGDRLTRQ